MSKVEIEVESGCCESCDCKMGDKAEKPMESKDALLKELKALLGNNNSTGMADRQMKIDELISKISELKED